MLDKFLPKDVIIYAEPKSFSPPSFPSLRDYFHLS